VPELPVRPDSGVAIRNLHLLRAYARLGEVHALAYREEGEPDESGALSSLCASIATVPVESCEAGSFREPRPMRGRLRELARARPSLARRYFSSQLQRRILGALPEVDLIHVSPLHMVANVLELARDSTRKAALVLDLYDLESVVHARRIGEATTWPRRGVAAWESARVWAYEREVIRHFDRVLVCSERDRRQLGRQNVRVIPNGATLHPRTESAPAGRPTLLYCGLLSYGPNARAAHYLVEEILPLIRRQIPDVIVRIVGKRPGPELRALDDGERVRVHADVPSIEPFYREADAAVIPLRIAGGTRLKILEAFSLGTPVVTTEVGCEGIDAVDGQHLLIENDAEGFARACVRLLSDAGLRARLIENAYRLVVDRYSWEKIQSSLEALSLEILAERRAAR
jgi:glycosyltransferase involved in cell wall biosynthesis